jgi:hypothetical protein
VKSRLLLFIDVIFGARRPDLHVTSLVLVFA